MHRGLIRVSAITIFALAAILAVRFASQSESSRIVPSTLVRGSQPVLAANFVAWYGFDHVTGDCRGGLGSTHWNDSPDTGGIVYEPEQGFYCSADPTIIASQLDDIQAAGIEVLLVSWWGSGDSNVDGGIDKPVHVDSYMNRAIEGLFQDIQAKDRPIKIALVVEPFPGTQTGRDLNAHPLNRLESRRVTDFVWNNYYDRYPDLTFRWEGRPLLLAFDPMRLTFDERFNIRRWTGGESHQHSLWDWWFAPQQDLRQRISEDGVVYIFPRFDERSIVKGGADYIRWPPRSFDPDLTEGLYESQWKVLRAERARLRMIVVYGWNLHGEQAAIEPGKPYGRTLIERTRAGFELLIAGPAN